MKKYILLFICFILMFLISCKPYEIVEFENFLMSESMDLDIKMSAYETEVDLYDIKINKDGMYITTKESILVESKTTIYYDNLDNMFVRLGDRETVYTTFDYEEGAPTEIDLNSFISGILIGENELKLKLNIKEALGNSYYDVSESFLVPLDHKITLTCSFNEEGKVSKLEYFVKAIRDSKQHI